MKLLSFLLFLLGNIAFAQSKDIIIKTGNLFLGKKDVIVYSTFYHHQQNAVGIDKIRVGRVYLDYYSEDSLYLWIRGKTPYLIQGLNQRQEETLRFSGFRKKTYFVLDSSYLSTTKYNKKGETLPEEIEISGKKIPNIPKLRVSRVFMNHKNIEASPQEVEEESSAWFCTPGEAAYYRYIKGIRTYYLVSLRSE